MCVIADAEGSRPIGLGGVMGGESTACSEATTDVFVESAWFDPIRMTCPTPCDYGSHGTHTMGTMTGLGVEFEPAAMQLDQSLHQRQPESRAAHLRHQG